MKRWGSLLSLVCLFGCDTETESSRAQTAYASVEFRDAPGSCAAGGATHCGGQSPDGCWCDSLCESYGDCCADIGPVCEAPPPPPTAAETCADGWCGEQSPAGCWCDDACAQFGNCCDDYQDACVAPEPPPPPPPPPEPEPEPTVDTCGATPSTCGGQAPAGCWCDPSCTNYGDCCDDYIDVCVNPPGPDPDPDPTPDPGPDPTPDPGPYYTGINPSATGETLASALHNLIDNHNVLSYGALWNAFQQTDGGVMGCSGIFDMYSGRCWHPVNDRCGTYQNEGDCFNREHSWPRSWWGGSTSTPQNSDLFHLYPSDGYVNGIRSNLPFCDVQDSAATYVSDGGARRGPCINAGFSGTGFEPPAEFRGDLARTYFYMAIRYRNEFSCCAREGVNRDDINPWLETLLRQWHAQDPVSAKEVARNEAVFELQGNRNPFIDHPEWVDQIADF